MKKTIKVPELEELAQQFEARHFTDEEDEIIRQYYYKVSSKAIAESLNKQFNKQHSASQIQKRASKLGLRKD